MPENTPNPSTASKNEETKTSSAKLGEDWKDDAVDQLASMMVDNYKTNDKAWIKRIPDLKKVSLVLGMTVNALSDAQSIVSKKSAMNSDGLGDLFGQAKSILSASASVLNNLSKDSDKAQIEGGQLAAMEAWNIVDFLYKQANSSCAQEDINGTLKEKFDHSNEINDLTSAKNALQWSSLFYTNLYHAYIKASFTSGGPDFAKQAYNLSIAQTTFGLVKNLVDAGTQIFSDEQATDPNETLMGVLMNSVSSTETLEYSTLQEKVESAQ